MDDPNVEDGAAECSVRTGSYDHVVMVTSEEVATEGAAPTGGECAGSSSQVLIAFHQDNASSSTLLPMSKETFVDLGHSDADVETISQIFIEVCSVEGMGLFTSAGQTADNLANKESQSVSTSSDPSLSQSGPPRTVVDQCVQANDYEIERRSGRVPARRRVIPYKFRDFRNPDSDDDNGEDSDYEPEKETRPPPKRRKTGTGCRGRPRKVKVEAGEPNPSVELQSDMEDNSSQTGGEKNDLNGKLRPITQTTKGYPCIDCAKVFSQKGNLKVHMRIHLGEKPFACDLEGCTNTFRSNETLRRHKLAHLGVKPFECEICQSKFSSGNSLREHMCRHTNTKPYRCDKCPKTFRQTSCFRRHLLTHTGQLPHTCEECGRRFSQLAYLRSHKKVHTGMKPFTCDQCGRSFAHQSDLSRHKIIHSGEKPFVCDLCNARFSDPSSRRRHVREHIGSKPFKCELCREEFKRAGQLKAHLNRKHNNLMEQVKVMRHSGGEMLQVVYKSGARSLLTQPRKTIPTLNLKALDEQNKIVHLLQSLNSGDSVHQISLVQDSTLSQCLAGEQNIGTPSLEQAECEQILIEAAEAGEVTVQSMGEQLIVSTLGSGGGSDSSELPEIQLEQQVVETQMLDVAVEMQTLDAAVETIGQVVDIEPTVIHIEPAGDNHCVNEDATVENMEPVAVAAEYMYQIIEEIGDKVGQPQQIVEIHCQSEDDMTEDVEVSNDTRSESPTSEAVQYADDEHTNLTTSCRDSQKDDDSVNKDSISSNAVDYVRNPDFASQEYYNWLSNFTELCKLVPMPLDVDLFQKISQVHKTLSDVMATPSGVVSVRENYKIMMSITKDLNTIINEHLSFVLENLDQTS